MQIERVACAAVDRGQDQRSVTGTHTEVADQRSIQDGVQRGRIVSPPLTMSPESRTSAAFGHAWQPNEDINEV